MGYEAYETYDIDPFIERYAARYKAAEKWTKGCYRLRPEVIRGPIYELLISNVNPDGADWEWWAKLTVRFGDRVRRREDPVLTEAWIEAYKASEEVLRAEDERAKEDAARYKRIFSETCAQEERERLSRPPRMRWKLVFDD